MLSALRRGPSGPGPLLTAAQASASQTCGSASQTCGSASQTCGKANEARARPAATATISGAWGCGKGAGKLPRTWGSPCWPPPAGPLPTIAQGRAQAAHRPVEACRVGRAVRTAAGAGAPAAALRFCVPRGSASGRRPPLRPHLKRRRLADDGLNSDPRVVLLAGAQQLRDLLAVGLDLGPRPGRRGWVGAGAAGEADAGASLRWGGRGALQNGVPHAPQTFLIHYSHARHKNKPCTHLQAPLIPQQLDSGHRQATGSLALGCVELAEHCHDDRAPRQSPGGWYVLALARPGARDSPKGWQDVFKPTSRRGRHTAVGGLRSAPAGPGSCRTTRRQRAFGYRLQVQRRQCVAAGGQPLPI